MRGTILLVSGFLAATLACMPALAETYPAPVGNCDAAVMNLEAARMAQLRTAAALAAGGKTAALCQADTAAMQKLSREAARLLTACPGMDDAMVQGRKMAAFAQAGLAAPSCKAP